ncbi:MAG: hypothetical protein LKJ46_08525 [Lactobacillus sp.]|jgi:hypothetical protein|nr:hypothetical protein [Lactobacillus sp.]
MRHGVIAVIWFLGIGIYGYFLIAKPQYRRFMIPLTKILIVGLALYFLIMRWWLQR